VLFGFRLGARPIKDNSMLTHLRTGIDIVSRGAIPRVDPYSYTARGTRWVVQSWLPEWTYGMAHRIGGYRVVVLEQAILTAFLAWLLVRLAPAGSTLRTTLAGAVAIGAGAAIWAPRPLLVGLICMGLTVAVVERRRAPWLLLPVVWLWVNSHGSFPLGLLWLGARAVGEALERRAWPREPMRYVGWFVAGLVVSVLNPLGARLLAFPFTLGQKREAFDRIVEWRSPDFHRAGGMFALVFLVLALALLFRSRVSWRDLVPSAVFVAACLYSVRNLGLTAVVLAPVLGRAVRRPESSPSPRPPVGTSPVRLRLNRALLVTIGLAFAVFAASIFASPGLELAPYPAAAVTYLDQQGLLRQPHRLAHQDFVGNYLILRYGTKASVFVDDRYDMYPVSVSRDYDKLLHGGGDSMEVLHRRQVDVVLWERKLPLPALLRATGVWSEAFQDSDWVVLTKRP
jgi:hypothetical protein